MLLGALYNFLLWLISKCTALISIFQLIIDISHQTKNDKTGGRKYEYGWRAKQWKRKKLLLTVIQLLINKSLVRVSRWRGFELITKFYKGLLLHTSFQYHSEFLCHIWNNILSFGLLISQFKYIYIYNILNITRGCVYGFICVIRYPVCVAVIWQYRFILVLFIFICVSSLWYGNSYWIPAWSQQ